MATRIRVRRDTTENWEEANPVLLEGEIGFDETKSRFKVGNGESKWNDLMWATTSTADTQQYIDEAIDEFVAPKIDALNGITGIWQGTQAEYDAIAHEEDVVYLIKEG